ncbi:choline/ethanolaminephosphotransferase 1-like [Liolophura sinensis]|uniref:choline/ethanolaminephosphotransferase 1-like n=1 Tax=Liolophura sinensis TaxID=3198878 RepID=UPI003157F57A
MSRVLSTAQLKRLNEHKYSAEGVSILEPLMQKFWRWLVEQIPTTWAPNTITSVGLIINVVTTLILVLYSPDAKQEPPRWAYFLCGLGLFVYQSLDAIDGKQARRTGTSSPLGELFDHGCDSLSTVFVILGTCIALQLGTNPGLLFFECFSAVTLFYIAHWQTYVSGTLRFGKLDVTEGQFSIIAIYWACCFISPSFWSLPVPVLGFPLKMFVVYFGVFGAILQLHSNFSVIFMQGGSGKNGSTVAGTSTIFPLFPVAAVIILAVVIYKKSPIGLFEQHPCLYVLSFGMVSAKVTNRLVVAHMTKSEMDLWDSVFIGPAMLFLNQYFNSFVNEHIVLWLCCIYCTYDLIHYSARVCKEICDFLKINCFTIPSKQPDNVQRTRNGKQF